MSAPFSTFTIPVLCSTRYAPLSSNPIFKAHLSSRPQAPAPPTAAYSLALVSLAPAAAAAPSALLSATSRRRAGPHIIHITPPA